jgi:hypothetical protein
MVRRKRSEVKGESSKVMASQKVVIPVKTGIHSGCDPVKLLDSRFHGNDEKTPGLTFYETIKGERKK